MARRFVFVALLVVVSAGVTLLLLEAGLRLVADDPEPEPVARVVQEPADEELPTFRSVVELSKPNQRGIFKKLPYRTNSAGFRGPETRRAKPPGTFRIVVIGDSVTMGSGVLEEEAYPALLADLLEPREGVRYEVLNLGVAGLSLRHSVGRLKNVGLQFSPDMIVYGFTVNDIEGPAYVYRRKHLEGKGAGEGALVVPEATGNSKLLALLRERFAAARELVGAAPDSYVSELQANYFENPKAWADFVDALDELAGIAKKRGVCGAVLIHAQLHYLTGLHPLTALYELVGGAAEERGLAAIDTLSAVVGSKPKSLWVHAFDPHPNAEGHRRFARTLATGLDELDPSCWRGASAETR